MRLPLVARVAQQQAIRLTPKEAHYWDSLIRLIHKGRHTTRPAKLELRWIDCQTPRMMVNTKGWAVLFLDELMDIQVLREMEELAEMQPIASTRGLTVIYMSVVLPWLPLELQEAKDPPKRRAK